MAFSQTEGFVDESEAGDRLAGLFAPDTLLPSQWYGDKSTWRSGECRLFYGIFRDAIECWQRVPLIEVATALGSGRCYWGPRAAWRCNRAARLRDAIEAHRWIFDYGKTFVSFEDVCAVWDVDAGRLRQDLIEWRVNGGKISSAAGERPSPRSNMRIAPERERTRAARKEVEGR